MLRTTPKTKSYPTIPTPRETALFLRTSSREAPELT